MIRLLSFLVFFSASSIVLAQPLYKWVESDGSITFSPEPPPAGVTFETVNAPSAEQTVTPRETKASQTDKASALQRALPQRGASTVQTKRLAPQQAIQTNAQPRIPSAPAIQPGITPSRAGGVMGAAADTRMGKNPESNGRSAAMTARSRKQRQCEDLQKRVVSLERRLKTRLTPEDMDNTVVHMARYQRSYDQHCVQ